MQVGKEFRLGFRPVAVREKKRIEMLVYVRPY